MTDGTITPAQFEELRLRAQAIERERKAQGMWAGGVRAHVEYQTRPVEWIVEHLGVPEHTLRWSMLPEYAEHQWDGDVDPLAKALEALGESKDVGIESATGIGKTFVAACVVFWFLAAFEDSIVVSAAPKEDQLLKHMWKEVGDLWPRFQRHFPEAELLTGAIRIKPGEAGKEKWAATAFVCGIGANEESATKAQGFHAAHLLIISEETPGIHPAIMNAFENTRTDDHNLHLALGNPDHRNDPLHQFCIQESVVHVRGSALDYPNIVCGRSVVPGAIGKRRLAERTTKYGKGSRLYESRVRGICPAESEDALIKWEWCVLASQRYDKLASTPGHVMGTSALGVDVANSEQGDKAAIARWEGECLTEVADFQCPDANILGSDVEKEMREREIDGRYVGVDSVGVGAGTINELKRLGVKVRPISSGTKAIPGLDEDTLWSEIDTDFEGKVRPRGATVIEAERFNNLRSQAWWRMREDLRMNRCAIALDEELFQDLTTPTYQTKNGIIVVESKEESVKRLKRSPNKGDAAVYGNWVRRRRPEKSPPREELVSSTHREYGLERKLAQLDKQQRADRRRMMRILGKPVRRA